MKSFKISIVFMLVALSVSADTCSNIKGLVHREVPDIKFYLVPNHPLYALINTIYPERGEQCFQSEQIAVDAGFFKLPFPKTDIIQQIRSTSPVEPMPIATESPYSSGRTYLGDTNPTSSTSSSSTSSNTGQVGSPENCQGCCSSHDGVVCSGGKTMCGDGSALSGTCRSKGCNMCVSQ